MKQKLFNFEGIDEFIKNQSSPIQIKDIFHNTFNKLSKIHFEKNISFYLI